MGQCAYKGVKGRDRLEGFAVNFRIAKGTYSFFLRDGLTATGET